MSLTRTEYCDVGLLAADELKDEYMFNSGRITPSAVLKRVVNPNMQCKKSLNR